MQGVEAGMHHAGQRKCRLSPAHSTPFDMVGWKKSPAAVVNWELAMAMI